MGDRVIGLQFHLETTPEAACALVENCGDEKSVIGVTPVRAESLGPRQGKLGLSVWSIVILTGMYQNSQNPSCVVV